MSNNIPIDNIENAELMRENTEPVETAVGCEADSVLDTKTVSNEAARVEPVENERNCDDCNEMNDVEEHSEENGSAPEDIGEVMNKTAEQNESSQVAKFKRQKKMQAIVSKILMTIVWIVSICLLYLCASNIYQQVFNADGYTGFFGIGEAVVASNSMEPKLYPNDLIFYREVEPYTVTEGDIVVYEKTNVEGSKMLVVHEVIAIGDGYVTTQGVNNAIPDESFPVSAIVGKYMFKIGKIGALLNLLSTSYAPLVIIMIMLLIVAVRVVVFYLNKRRIIAQISTDNDTRAAIKHFFDADIF